MKKAITVILVLAALLLINSHFNLIQNITIQFSKDKYISHVSNMEAGDIVVDEIDKYSADKKLIETSVFAATEKHEFHDTLKEKYKLSEIADAETDFDRVLKILGWLTENTYYNGAQMRPLADDSLKILDYSFSKPFRNAINCRLKAISFADCLVAVGIKAYPVCMQSADFSECHFTCRAYIEELKKWCVFDPSFGCWFSDEKNVPADIYEVRKMFINGNEPIVHGYNFNGTKECFDVYINLFLKDCISNLSTWENNSAEGRDSISFSERKDFNAYLPQE